MSRTERLLRLIQVLRRQRRPITGRELAGEMAVSLRTIYRDIDTLVHQGAPITGGAGLGYVMRPGFLLPPLMFDDEEIEALVLGARWVAQQPDEALARSARDVVSKITAVLPGRLRERVEDAGLFAVPRPPSTFDSVDASVMRQAIREERKLAIVYRDETGQQTSRVVWPIALGFFEQVRMLVAWCEMRRAFRHFRTDRIASAQLRDEHFPRPRRLLLKEWQAAEGMGDPPI